MFKLTNRQYDVSKWALMVGFPAFATFYLTMSQLWGIPGADKVVGTLAALATFGGVVLGVSSNKYKNAIDTTGEEVFEENPPASLFTVDDNGSEPPPFSPPSP